MGDAFEAIDSLAASAAPLAIFLDDFERVSHPDAHTLVARLIATLGPAQQLVIGSREVPDLGLAKLRASGHLVEIGADKLRFSAEETRRFLLDLRACAWGPEVVSLLHARSEGWPAALQLAVLALGDSPEGAERLRGFGGTLAEVADYLATEVLERLPADLREFALATSILGSFSAELAEAVTGMPDGAALIDRVGRANLFLVSLDAERRWFRYHALAGEFLRARLERAGAARIPEMHRRAALWLAANGRPAEAVEHALRSGDEALAAHTMERCSTELLHEGRIETLLRWAAQIPAARLAAHPALHFEAALANVVSHRYAEARRLIEAFDAEADESAPRRRRDSAMLRFNFAIWSDQLQGLREALNEAVALFSAADGFVYASMLNCVGYLAFLEGSPDMGRSALAAAKVSPHHRDNEVVRAYSEAQAAMAHLARGELRDARDTANAEFERLAAAGSRYGTSRAIAAIVLADAHYERNELAAARVLLDEYMGIAADSCIPDLIVTAFLERSRIARREGEGAAADETIARLQRLGEERGLARLVASALFEKSRVALAEGRIETAAAHVREASAHEFWKLPVFRGTFGNDLENPDIGAARLALFNGATASIAPLEACLGQAEGTGRRRRAMKLRILLAQALWLSGQRRPAMSELLTALQSAAPEGLVRVLADEPWVLPDMLSYADRPLDPAVRAFARKVAEACAPSFSGSSRQDAGDGEKRILSARELQVLALLTRGLSNKLIAAELDRSEATIATHLRRIYEKLGAHNRTQAIATARRAGLLD
jgi:LuxR family maltose regulon positive regulatory protein